VLPRASLGFEIVVTETQRRNPRDKIGALSKSATRTLELFVASEIPFGTALGIYTLIVSVLLNRRDDRGHGKREHIGPAVGSGLNIDILGESQQSFPSFCIAEENLPTCLDVPKSARLLSSVASFPWIS
jgi:hypothetical protein